ncbi:hypothetical protein ACTXG6_04875 [Pseudonocardia sp. Cha107L01]|uniref:hypothetical protein n=1 Tax=Pseudonocardia sp. Cha107L01 TaxID=3457576 RepID=UPI00403E9A61
MAAVEPGGSGAAVVRGDRDLVRGRRLGGRPAPGPGDPGARRPKDEADLATLLPVLDGAQRDWLARSITVVHPEHPWIAAVAGRGA